MFRSTFGWKKNTILEDISILASPLFFQEGGRKTAVEPRDIDTVSSTANIAGLDYITPSLEIKQKCFFHLRKTKVSY